MDIVQLSPAELLATKNLSAKELEELKSYQDVHKNRLLVDDRLRDALFTKKPK